VKRLLVASALAASLLLGLAGPSLASNHRKVSSECAAGPATSVANRQEPVGLTPDAGTASFFAGLVPATGSDVRSVIATGIVLVDEDGFFVGLDLTQPALNGQSGVENGCPNA
jgi:hypothetical protein